MVKFSLDSLNFINYLNKSVPSSFPKRSAVIIKHFRQFYEEIGEDGLNVSIEVSAKLERTKAEARFSDEPTIQQDKIIEDLIKRLPLDSITTHHNTPRFLITNKLKCNCGSDLRVAAAPKSRSCVLFTTEGAVQAHSYKKICKECKSTHYPSYSEYTDDMTGEIYRQYDSSSAIVAATQDTYFEKRFLSEVREDLCLLDTKFRHLEEKYNTLYGENSIKPLNYKRLELVFIVHEISIRVPEFKFPVIRKESSELDQEEICKAAFGPLSAAFHQKWMEHECEGCQSHAVVMDGNCKLFRNVCAAEGQKIEKRGDLTVFDYCTRSPATDSKFCSFHQNGKVAKAPERLDTGPLTRKMRNDLGLGSDVLLSGLGCRKQENVTVRSKRSVTAGMMFCMRPCGVTLSSMEMIHAENCTDFISLLIQTFGTDPRSDQISMVVLDRACGVHPLCLRVGSEGHEVCQRYANLPWCVDAFHVKGHKRPECQEEDGIYHPAHPRNKTILKTVNQEVCEQMFKKINQSKGSTRYMQVYFRLCFFKILDWYRNDRIVKKNKK